jgi:hypothetical protein
MSSLIKRTNLQFMSSNIENYYNHIVQLIRLINIPLKFIKLIPLSRNKIINKNKFLYYRIVYETLKKIHNKLPIYQRNVEKYNKRIIKIDIYIDHKNLNSYSKFST